ncbi:MAG: thiamine ABC transporter substrate-binding protein, partial [Anaerolineales bacterium]
MKKRIQAIIGWVALGLLLAACVPSVSVPETPTTVAPSLLTVMTHDSFAVSEEVIRAFEQENNLKVEFLKSGDTGSALNRAILTKASPQADVFYGVDNTFLSRALEADIFVPYDSPALQ